MEIDKATRILYERIQKRAKESRMRAETPPPPPQPVDPTVPKGKQQRRPCGYCGKDIVREDYPGIGNLSWSKMKNHPACSAEKARLRTLKYNAIRDARNKEVAEVKAAIPELPKRRKARRKLIDGGLIRELDFNTSGLIFTTSCDVFPELKIGSPGCIMCDYYHDSNTNLGVCYCSKVDE